MDPLNIKSTFNKLRPDFVCCLNVDHVLDDLVSGEYLDVEDAEEIRKESTTRKKARHLMDMLSRMPSDAHYCVLKSMKKKSKMYGDLLSSISQLMTVQPIEESSASNSQPEMYGVPTIPPGFIDRPEYIQEILNGLKESYSKKAWLLIHGFSGIGKSLQAAKSLHDDAVRERYTDGIFWIQLRRKDERLSKLQSLIEMFDPESQRALPQSVAPALVRLKGLLKKRPNALIVLDKAWDDLCAFDLDSHVMVTSRDANIIDRSNHRKTIKVHIKEGFSWPQCKKVLSESLHCDPNCLPPEANQLYTQCLALPLAISMVGSQLEDFPDRLQNYIDFLVANRLEDIEHEKSDYPYATLFDAIADSVDHLMEKHPDLGRKLMDIAVFDDASCLSLELLSTLWDCDRIRTENDLKKLVKKSLMYEVDEIRYGVHVLLLKVLKKKNQNNMAETHRKLTDNFSRKCKGEWLKLKVEDTYIWWHVAHHLYHGKDNEKLIKLYTDLRFVEAKLIQTGASHIINDLHKYLLAFVENDRENERQEFLDFLQSNADLLDHYNLNPRSPSLIQLALCQPHDSVVYRQGLQLARESRELYWKWSNSEMAFKRPLWSTRTFKEMMCCSSISADEKRILAGNDQGNLVVLDSHSGQTIFSFQAHEGAVRQCVFLPKHDRFVSCSEDGSIRVFKMPEFACQPGRLLPCGDNSVGHVIPHAWGHGAFKQATCEDLLLDSIHEKQRMQNARCLAVASSGKFILAGLDDGRVKYYALAAEGKLTEEKQYRVHSQCVTSIHLHPSDSRLFVSSSPEGSVKVVDLERGKCLRDYEGHKLDEQSPEPRVVGFLPEPIQRDGALVASFANTAIHIWNYQSGECTRRFIELLEGDIKSVDFSRDGRLVAAGSACGMVKVCSYEDERILYHLYAPRFNELNMLHFLDQVTAQDDAYIEVNYEDLPRPKMETVRQYSALSKDGLSNFSNMTTSSSAVNVLVGCASSTLLRWGLDSYCEGTPCELLRLPLKLQFESWCTEDGRMLVIAEDCDGNIQFISGDKGCHCIHVELLAETVVTACAINSQASRVAIAYHSGKIEVYDIRWSSGEVDDVEWLFDMHIFGNTALCLTFFTTSVDEEFLAYTDERGLIVLVSMRDSPKQSTSWLGHSASIPHCRYLTNKEQLLTIGEDGFVKLWTMDFGDVEPRMEAVFAFQILQRNIVNFDIDSFETRLVACSNDGLTKVWDLPSGTLLNTLRTEEESLSALVCRFCPGREDLLAMGDSLGHVRIWQLLTEDRCQQYRLSSDLDRSSSDERERRLSSEAERPSIGVNDLSWSPDGRTLVSISDKVRAWTVDMTALTNGKVDRPPIRTFYMRGRFACHLRAVSDRLVTVDNAGTLYILGDVRSLGEGDVGLPVES